MKKYDVNKVKAAIIAKLETAKFNEIELTMKCNGDVVTIKPTGYNDIYKLEDAEYFLVSSPSLPFISSEKFDEVAENIARYEELIQENEERKREYARYIKEHGYWDPDHPGCFSWQASDIHKDIWGFRPRSEEYLKSIIAKYA